MLHAIVPLLLVLSAPAAGAEEGLLYFDLKRCVEESPEDSVLRYDTVKFVSSLQGLVNRQGPRLILRFLDGAGRDGAINLDDYWLARLRTGWLRDLPLARAHTLDDLVARFGPQITGWVVWDTAVPATANVAATVCGVEGWLPLRHGSVLQERLAGLLPDVGVKLDLCGRFDGRETGSAKCDAYLWAKRTYLDTGKCHPALMAYFIDAYTQQPGQAGFAYTDLPNATLTNHDYYIAHKAFFFDLGVWPDEAPVDDPGAPPGTDRETLIALLRAQYEQNEGKQFSTVGGFVPWNLKYTAHGPAGGKHAPVPTEWEYAAILSAHNAVMDADALGLSCLTNASAYMHHPLETRYRQNPKPAPVPLEAKTYVLVYMGDYDSAAWLSRHIPVVWDDPVRGEIPIAWAFNPNLSDRVPYVFDHVYRGKTANDWFIAGDSGAGYLNPNLLTGERLGSGLPDALDLWVARNKRYYTRFDYGVTGFVINGFHGDMPLRVQAAYASFSPDGVGMQLGFEKPLVAGTPFLRHTSDIYPKGGALSETAREMAAFAKGPQPQFLIFRWILQKPSTLKSVQDLLAAKHSDKSWCFCDPYTFFDLYRRRLNGDSNLFLPAVAGGR